MGGAGEKGIPHKISLKGCQGLPGPLSLCTSSQSPQPTFSITKSQTVHEWEFISRQHVGRGEGADPARGQGSLYLLGTSNVHFVERRNRNSQKYLFTLTHTHFNS